MTRVGIIGGGQLGRMLALAGHDLGIACTTLDPAAGSPAAAVAPAIVGAYGDHDRLTDLAGRSDVVTYEFENVPVEAARAVERLVPVFPPPAALEASQDRLAEKELFSAVGLPVAAYAPVDSLPGLTEAVERLGTPAVLKTRRLGYDGKGQAVIHDPSLAEDAWRSVGAMPCLLEELVSFDRELSIVAVRGRDGKIAAYPVVENRHRDGILRVTCAPAPGLDADLQEAAEAHARALMAELGYVGVLAIELFQTGTSLLANEMAPRVHNSGHWTIEGAETSQFENHLRAVCGFPLGATDAIGVSAMVNLIGSMPDRDAMLAIPGAHLHDYGKEARPGRKLGHVTVRAASERSRAGVGSGGGFPQHASPSRDPPCGRSGDLGRRPLALEGHGRDRRPLRSRPSPRRSDPPRHRGHAPRAGDHGVGRVERRTRARDGQPARWHRDADVGPSAPRRHLPEQATADASLEHVGAAPRRRARRRTRRHRHHGSAASRLGLDRVGEPGLDRHRRGVAPRHRHAEPVALDATVEGGVRRSQRKGRRSGARRRDAARANPMEGSPIGRVIAIFSLAAAVTLIAGVLLEQSGDALATRFGIDGVIFGATVLALITALPEISTGIAAVRMGEVGLAMGDIFGGNAIQITLFLVADLLAGKPVLPEASAQSGWLAALGIVVTAIYLNGLMTRPADKVLGLVGPDSAMVTIAYGPGVAGLVYVS